MSFASKFTTALVIHPGSAEGHTITTIMYTMGQVSALVSPISWLWSPVQWARNNCVHLPFHLWGGSINVTFVFNARIKTPTAGSVRLCQCSYYMDHRMSMMLHVALNASNVLTNGTLNWEPNSCSFAGIRLSCWYAISTSGTGIKAKGISYSLNTGSSIFTLSIASSSSWIIFQVPMCEKSIDFKWHRDLPFQRGNQNFIQLCNAMYITKRQYI